MAPPIVLYDGVCGLCNRFVQFVLRRDKKEVFRFASLQSAFAGQVLKRHGANPDSLATLYVVVEHEGSAELLLARSEAVAFALMELGGVWRLAARLLLMIPRAVRDWGYGLVARNRYRVFGRYESCPLPDLPARGRFLDQ